MVGLQDPEILRDESKEDPVAESTMTLTTIPTTAFVMLWSVGPHGLVLKHSGNSR